MNFKYKNHNLVYINCSSYISKIYNSINSLDLDVDMLKDRDLKKLIFHFLVQCLLKEGKNKKFKEKPVYFIFKKDIPVFNIKFLNSFTYVFRHLKSLLPVPLLVIEHENVFKGTNGDIIGLNNKITNFYIKSKRTTAKLRKYLEEENFYELINLMQDVKNIKALSH